MLYMIAFSAKRKSMKRRTRPEPWLMQSNTKLFKTKLLQQSVHIGNSSANKLPKFYQMLGNANAGQGHSLRRFTDD